VGDFEVAIGGGFWVAAGDHLVEGMKFNMGGWWVVKFRVSASGRADSVVFNLKL
jgi:hypothetical protein